MGKRTKNSTNVGEEKCKPSKKNKGQKHKKNLNVIQKVGFARSLIKVNLVLPTGLLVATTQDSENSDIHVCLLQHNIVKLRPNYTKVRMIDSLISNNECSFIIKSAEDYAVANGGWTSSRHTNYATTDIPVDGNHVDDLVNGLIFPQLAAYFDLNIHNLQIGG